MAMRRFLLRHHSAPEKSGDITEMSRDVGDRRHRRRRLLIYRPSSCDPPEDAEPSPESAASTSHGNEGSPWLKSTPSGDRGNVHQRGPLLRTNCSREKPTNEPPLQTPPARCHMEAQCVPPLQTPPARCHMEVQCVPPLQTPCFRGHRARAQHGHVIPTSGRRSDELACLLASPLERSANRILFVELQDVSHQVTPHHLQDPPTVQSLSGDCSVFGGSDGVATLPSPDPSTPPALPLSQPAVLQRWGLVPLFQTVRSKLENFAEIFFSPKKRRQEEVNGSHGVFPEGPTVHSAADPPTSCPPSSVETEEDPKSAPSASNTDVNLQVSIEISSAVSTLCRPPLHRCHSCPLPPLQPPRRFSLETTERDVPACSCRAKALRKRRHSVGTVEECRKLPLTPVSLSCLRKEKHPSALRPNCQPGGLQYAISSPPGHGLDGVRVPEQNTGGPDTTEGPHPLSQELKESKVSAIQIRKRVARPEGSLTPMGLPKRLRLQKDNFSLEEIYTNKNYHTPTEKRKFETIFEEPVMKGGALVLTGQRPLRRTIVFKDSGAPRRRKKRGRGGSRSRRGADNKSDVNFELLLKNKLDQLEAELQHEEAMDLH